MELRVLGCHGGESPKHKTSSFLLDSHLAIDAGAITSMLTFEEQKKVDWILVSHAHMDHVRDLATLADTRCQQDGTPIRVVSTEATIAHLKTHFFNDRLWPDFSKIATSHGPTVEFIAIDTDHPVELDGYQVRAVPVHHTIDACGFLVRSGGVSVAYSGDTGPTDRFWDLLNDAPDLKAALVEVSFPDHMHQLAKISGHYTPESLAGDLNKLRAGADVPVLLYHIKPIFMAQVEKQLAQIRGREAVRLELDDRFTL